jgi:predicted ABC-type ATPase
MFLALPSPELAVARVAERVRQGGHDVPERTVRRRFVSGLRNLFTLYQVVADSWQVFDNSQLAGPRLIASGHATSQAEIVDREAWTRIREVL